MIIIDTDKLNKLGLNINEYLTILKVHNPDIAFRTSIEYLNSVENKGFITGNDEGLKLTHKSKIEFKLTSLEEDITEVIEYFKKVADKPRIDSTSLANRRFIRDRLTKYSVDDLKQVIDLKVQEWNNSPSMKQYIRIETLFNETKFQKYISQLDTKVVELNSGGNIKRI